MKCFSDGRKYMKKWTLTEFFWKSKLAFFGLSDGTNFKILRRFFGFLLFFGRKTPPNSGMVWDTGYAADYIEILNLVLNASDGRKFSYYPGHNLN